MHKECRSVLYFAHSSFRLTSFVDTLEDTMSALVEMPHVVECAVAGCSYNHDGCNAFAVTIDNDTDCATFIDIGTRGGLDRVVAQVGACQRTACAFNSSLECTAEAVRIGPGGSLANCLTYVEA